MPRVNRDLQRRMAARRERDRRRPSAERRYRFATPEQGVEADEALLAEGRGAADAVPDEAVTRVGRPARESGVTRTTHQPFSAYREEYAYVYGDLRRVGLVIGSLLVVLIVLYFVLPLFGR